MSNVIRINPCLSVVVIRVTEDPEAIPASNPNIFVGGFSAVLLPTAGCPGLLVLVLTPPVIPTIDVHSANSTTVALSMHAPWQSGRVAGTVTVTVTAPGLNLSAANVTVSGVLTIAVALAADANRGLDGAAAVDARSASQIIVVGVSQDTGHLTQSLPHRFSIQVRHGPASSVFNDPMMISIGEKHGISPAQVALRWLVQQNISIVTAAENPDSEYIKEDIDLFSFELSAPEMEQLAAL